MALYDFMLYALLAGVMLALAAAPLGCFVIWRKMAYFGDALAHSALLGVVAALYWQLPVTLCVIPVALLFAAVLSRLGQRSLLSTDTLIGIVAQGSLALGMVVLAMTPSIQLDLTAFLFGDILAITYDDLSVIYVLAAVVIALLRWRWRKLVLMTISEDLARVNGVAVEKERALLMLLIALTVAISVKLVGLLLITSLLVLPAACARFVSTHPGQMAFRAAIIGQCMVLTGLAASLKWDTPSGPSIVLAGVGIFLLISLLTQRLGRRA